MACLNGPVDFVDFPSQLNSSLARDFPEGQAMFDDEVPRNLLAKSHVYPIVDGKATCIHIVFLHFDV